MKDYTVVVTTETTHTFFVEDCNSPEEAESIAEEMLDDGEVGDEVDQEIVGVDSFEEEHEEEED